MKLHINNLNKAFKGLQATNAFSLDIEDKSFHALIGPNGAGKTTLIRQISGELFPDCGEIYMDDRPVTRLKDYDRARLGLIRTFQISSLIFDMTVTENLLLCLTAKRKAFYCFTKNVFADSELTDEAEHILKKYDLLTFQHTPVKNLSHGIKRQIELLMALAMEPKMLLLDEPAAGMGIDETKAFIEWMNKIKGKFTVLLVEHDMDVVFSLADTISVMELGSLLVSGSPNEISEHEEVRKIYLGN